MVHTNAKGSQRPRANKRSTGAFAIAKEGDALWNWVEEKALHRKFAKGQAANTRTFGMTMDDGAIVLGAFERAAGMVPLRPRRPGESGASGDSAMVWARRSCPLIDNGHCRRCRTPGCKARMAGAPATDVVS